MGAGVWTNFNTTTRSSRSAPSFVAASATPIMGTTLGDYGTSNTYTLTDALNYKG